MVNRLAYNSLLKELIHLIHYFYVMFKKRVGVRMTQRQNDTARHFGTESHFSTATKCHSASHLQSDKMTRCFID